MCSGESLLGALVQDEGLQPPRRLHSCSQEAKSGRFWTESRWFLGGGKIESWDKKTPTPRNDCAARMPAP